MTISNFSYSLYSSAMSCAKRYIEPSRIEEMEKRLASLAVRGTALVTPIIALIPLLTSMSAAPDLPCLAEHGPLSRFSPTLFILGAVGVGLAVAFPRLQKMDQQLKKWIQPYKEKFINEEIAVLVEKSSSNDKLALVFRAPNDKTRAFTTHHEISALQKSTKGHKVTLISGCDETEIGTQMAQAKDIYHRVIIRAHGDNTEILIGDKFRLTRRSTNILNWLKEHTHKGADILIESCEAAKGEQNIARDISRACPHATVYAAKTSTGTDSITYDDEGIPSFRPLTDGEGTGPLLELRDATCIYENGKLFSLIPGLT